MAEAKKIGTIFKTGISRSQTGSSYLARMLGPRFVVSSNGHYPGNYVEQALSAWECEKARPEVSRQLSETSKRKFLPETKLEIEGRRFRVKFYSYRGRLKSLLENAAYRSEAMRNFQMMEYCHSMGVLAPKPLLLMEGRLAGVALESVLMMEDLDPARSYKETLKELEADPAELNKFLREVFSSLARFNRTGIYTLDADKNILVKRQDGQYQIYYFDFDNVFPFRKNNPRRAGRSLAFLIRTRKLYQKLAPDQIAGLVDLYLEGIGKRGWKDAVLREISGRLSKKSAAFAPAKKPG